MSVTREQLKEVAEKLFSEIDINGNGKLEKSEVRAFSEGIFNNVNPGEKFNVEQFEQSFATMDKNQDGSVSKEELFKTLLEKAQSDGTLK